MTARTKSQGYEGFTAEERAAMKDHAEDLKAASRRGSRANKAEAEEEAERSVLSKIAEMPDRDRRLAERVHAIVTAAVPDLRPRLWYGMPAYAKDDELICFFQNAQKFKSRFAMLGFSDKANLDDGTMWPVYYALTELTAADETRIAELVQKAVS